MIEVNISVSHSDAWNYIIIKTNQTAVSNTFFERTSLFS